MNEVEKNEINEMAKAICSHCLEMTEEKVCPYANTEDELGNEACFTERLHEAEKVYNAGYGKVEDYKKEIFALKTTLEDREYEVRELNKKVERFEQSLSDCAFMTSSIGDLPINSVGLRRAVDEIARLQITEAELQELNAKYYNEAKDSRRKIESLKEENEILKIQLEQANCGIVNCSGCALVEQQAIKEFAKRLYDKYGKSCSEYYPEIIELTHKELDDLLKEYGIGETK